jgi:hypothetical protein
LQKGTRKLTPCFACYPNGVREISAVDLRLPRLRFVSSLERRGSSRYFTVASPVFAALREPGVAGDGSSKPEDEAGFPTK